MELLNIPGVHWIRNDQCAAGAGNYKPSTGQWLHIRKTTGWLTNSLYSAKALACFQCPNRQGFHVHDHLQLVDGKAKHAAAYPVRLVTALLVAIRQELQSKSLLSIGIYSVGCDGGEKLDWQQHAEYYDNITGLALPSDLVKAARMDEIKFLQSFPVYVKVPASQARGKKKVSVRWVDVNKGDGQNMQMRSRPRVRLE